MRGGGERVKLMPSDKIVVLMSFNRDSRGAFIVIETPPS